MDRSERYRKIAEADLDSDEPNGNKVEFKPSLTARQADNIKLTGWKLALYQRYHSIYES